MQSQHIAALVARVFWFSWGKRKSVCSIESDLTVTLLSSRNFSFSLNEANFIPAASAASLTESVLSKTRDLRNRKWKRYNYLYNYCKFRNNDAELLLGRTGGQQVPGHPLTSLQAVQGVAKTTSYQMAQSLIGRHWESWSAMIGQL